MMNETQRRNLSRRLPAPAKGNGRLQKQIRRCFLLGELQSTSQVLDWCYVLNRKAPHRYSVWRELRKVADPVGRMRTRGRAWLWRIRPQTASEFNPIGQNRAEDASDT